MTTLDQATLEQAARLLLGDEYKRPLARLLGPFHPAGPRETLDPRLPFRWFAPPLTADGEPNPGHRPIPGCVWPVLADLLEGHALHLETVTLRKLAREAREARKLSLNIFDLARKGGQA